MKSAMKLLLFLACCSCAVLHAETPKPALWISPTSIDNGRSFRELFEHPDDWKDARSMVDVLFYTDLNLKRQFSDDELRAWFAQMKIWNVKLAMEVGAIKEWGQTGEKCFAAERANWEHLQNLGADLHAIGMDEPLCCTREHIHKTDDYVMQETANYIALVREHFPKLLIGDIEAYPSVSIEEHKHWIDGLQKLLAEKKVRGLDFYRLDVDWLRFNVQQKGSWQEVRQLEHYCRQRQLPFSLIYWPSGYPSMQKRGMADDSTWYVSVLQQGYDYAAVDGRSCFA